MASVINRHLDEEEIEKYSLNSISEAETGHIEEHLLICEACRQQVAQSDLYVSSMRRAATRLRNAPPRTRQHSWAAATRLLPVLAAGVLVVLAAFVWFARQR
ncbi:MAG: hypothetical protein LAP87_08925 [Acidobacteriia bacterium]|nr:hypothetical protein [Terriglobia bacterium]